MSSGSLSGLAAIVNKSRTGQGSQPEQDEIPEPQRQSAPAKPHRRSKEPPIVDEPARAKYADPAFTQMKVYVRRKTKLDAAYKWQSEGRGDLSELVETLLRQYLSS